MSTVEVKKFKSKIRVHGRALTYFGSQSISNDASAIFELVKNSRDADAKKVVITFENLGKEKARITVEDDGNGMTYDEIMENWLVAATDMKIRKPKSEGGKIVWGEMGIGRFACDKLAKKTTMLSYPKGSKKMVRMFFNWDLYREPGAKFDDVEHPGSEEEKDTPSKHGLTLVLEGLHYNWTSKKISQIADELGTFILPKELKGPDDIDIIINAEQYGVKTKHVEGTVTEIAPIKLSAAFDDGKLSAKISDIEVNNGQWKGVDIDEEYDDLKCGPLTFNLYFYPRDTAKKGSGKWESYYEKKLKEFDIDDFLDEHAGIYLYRDGAWMKPLGGKADWLHLEARRVQRGSRIGLSQVYGIIRISQKSNPDIRPTAHRETIQENEAFNDLKKIIMACIVQLEKHREAKKTQEPRPSEEIPIVETLAKNNLDTITKTINDNRTKLTETTYKKLKNDISTTRTYVELLEVEKEEEIKKFGELRHHEDTIAAIGLLTSYMAYEIADPLNENIGVVSAARKTMESTDFSKPIPSSVINTGWDWLRELEENTKKIVHFVSFVRTLSQHIAASVRREGRSSQFDIADAWETVKNGFGDFATKFEIDVSEDMDKKLRIRFSRIDLEAILTNLFLNSIDALKKKKEGQRRIRFIVRYNKNGLMMKFSDDGRGIPLKHIDKIFDPFYTISENPEDTAHGHGLGLAIVKKIVDRHGGKAEARSPAEEYKTGATITITIPAENVPVVVSRG